jgi:hypothetical protein
MWKPGDAIRYRDRAEELRTKADTFSPENRAMLLNMAAYYDGFSREADTKDAARRAVASDGNSNRNTVIGFPKAMGLGMLEAK